MVPNVVDIAPESCGVSMPESGLITHDIAAECFLDAFRRRVGRGAGKVPVADLADAIDVQARTVKSWRDTTAMPHWALMLRLCCYFGPTFTSELLAPAGLGGVARVAIAHPDPQGTATDLVQVASDLLERLRDGKFCHVDRAETGPRLLELSRELESQARALGAR